MKMYWQGQYGKKTQQLYMTESIEKGIFYTGAAGILFLPVSISATQFFLYLSSLMLMVFFLKKRSFAIFREGKTLIVVFFLFYGSIFFSSLLNAVPVMQFFRHEGKDMFLFLYFLWSYYFARSSLQKQLFLFLFLAISMIFLIGWVSAFVPFRLGNLPHHIAHGFYFDGTYREQHLLFSLETVFPGWEWKFPEKQLPFGIYIPVGFTQSHLSFGGMVALSFIFLTYLFLSHYRKKISQPVTLFITLYWILYGLLFFFTYSRSAFFGYFIFTGFVVLLFQFPTFFKVSGKFFFWLFASILLLFFVTYQMEFTKKIISEIRDVISITTRHTDYQRILLWYVAIRVFLSYPLGVGAGNFRQAIFQEILKVVEEKPYLWYPLYQTEIMHAHNDFLHFLVTGGVLSGILYVVLFYIMLSETKYNKNAYFPETVTNSNKGSLFSHFLQEENFKIFAFLPVFLLFAGLWQSYMLDDYVMQYFWLLYGTGLGIIHNKIRKE